MKEKSKAKVSGTNARQPRASITFPPKLYRLIEALAKEKKVSMAWVVREATELYVAQQAASPIKNRDQA
jgi:predicted DNA-binding protein